MTSQPWLEVINRVRQQAPLVHCITATVSMSIVADGLLAAGARPMMTETEQEAPLMDSVADALLINLGTLSTDGMTGIPSTVSEAEKSHRPWVLDPTVVGLAPVRTQLANVLLFHTPNIVRGNASEIRALAGIGQGGRGADSTDTTESARSAAQQIADSSGAVIAVSGAHDLIVNETKMTDIAGGSELLTRVTGTGCLLGALSAACLAVAEPFVAAEAASYWLKKSGEYAASKVQSPGSFRVALLDALDQVCR